MRAGGAGMRSKSAAEFSGNKCGDRKKAAKARAPDGAYLRITTYDLRLDASALRAGYHGVVIGGKLPELCHAVLLALEH